MGVWSWTDLTVQRMVRLRQCETEQNNRKVYVRADCVVPPVVKAEVLVKISRPTSLNYGRGGGCTDTFWCRGTVFVHSSLNLTDDPHKLQKISFPLERLPKIMFRKLSIQLRLCRLNCRLNSMCKCSDSFVRMQQYFQRGNSTSIKPTLSSMWQRHWTIVWWGRLCIGTL